MFINAIIVRYNATLFVFVRVTIFYQCEQCNIGARLHRNADL